MDKTQKDIAEYALEALKKAGADKAACTVTSDRKDEFNVEAGKFSLLRTLFGNELHLKAIRGGRKGIISINKLDKESIDLAVSDCIQLAASATPDEAENIAEKTDNKSFEQRIGGADMDALFKRSKEFVEQVGDELPKVVLDGMASEFNSTATIYINSNGVEFSLEREFYRIDTSFLAKDGTKSSSSNYYSANLSSLDTPFIDIGMHRRLLEEVVRSLDTRMVDEKFTGKVIVTPAGGDVIWSTILANFLSDAPLVQGTSRWKDALGTKVTDAKLTMRTVPLHPAIVAGERFTADGYESKDMDLIRDGVLASFALSLYGARKTRNRRALNTSRSIEVAAGSTSLADMIKNTERGILLNRFSGGSPGSSGDISGVAKNSFLIENGQVTDALSETMISFNILDALASIPAISAERCENGIDILPWCCLDGITISGK